MHSKVSSEYLAPAGEEEESASWRQTKVREPEPLRGPPERPFGEAHLSSLLVRDRACAQVEVPRLLESPAVEAFLFLLVSPCLFFFLFDGACT